MSPSLAIGYNRFPGDFHLQFLRFCVQERRKQVEALQSTLQTLSDRLVAQQQVIEVETPLC